MTLVANAIFTSGARIKERKKASADAAASSGTPGSCLSRRFLRFIADDLENEEQAESEEQRDKLRSWFNKTLLNTGHPHTNVVVIGTILHQ
ncbi:MAG TPA: hypothetical protein VMW72_01395, partial [Sedimentisphaerales bacterium]|nr:hypothetical protein [Sedimentisphaerales bacterium]